jgi:hypothetical protein
MHAHGHLDGRTWRWVSEDSAEADMFKLLIRDLSTGTVIPTRGAIIPAAVGVDIGCGMMAVQTSLHANHLPDNLHGIRTSIEKAVPHGRTDNGRANDRGAW